jgi:dolichyl-phosphate-mannose--protein O-mannosyl transferase
MDHPFNSPWWQWPFILKPMWFCQDKFEPTGFASTIMCMGNPLIFYVGAVCMAAVFALFIGKHLRFKGGLRLRQGDGNLTLALLVLGFLTQYLPWVLVPRSMYIYHYFASVPFIILATTVVFDLIPWPKAKKRAMIVYVALAAGFFALFYPYASGLLTPTSWLDWLKWFPKIYY